ncbi:ribonuclease H1 [Cephus cinctus]|uniref:Ribonuclease H n=1 Tax=Cephus cinctus TaxID=211228 RepID=A0AAJ7BZ00_CEPCN|nr:ribonuclease H1 [Cephus cinctus]
MRYYAVVNGRNPGIYSSWEECKSQVDRYSHAVYKKFFSLHEAEWFLRNHGFSSCSSDDDYSQESRDSEGAHYGISQRSYSTQRRYTFDIDSDGYVNVYTDGACSSNGYSHAKAGIGVYFGDNHPLNVSQPVSGRATNHNAEIQAVTKALEQAKKAKIKYIKINTDSRFLINCINHWMPKWKRNGWRTRKGKNVINKQELIQMENAMNGLNVIFEYVPGHQGIYGNEMADKLACEGAADYRG